VSLEPLDVRDFAVTDPRGFLARYRGGAVLDEVQRAPALFSYLQEELDRDPVPGRFILTGRSISA
ncbi:MAG: AAA family ATPase, partial [Gemmatimonadetes bacterium]|nr:AAA family ATPase [Gemmatimonadota bacterium]